VPSTTRQTKTWSAHWGHAKYKKPAKMATLTNRACKFRVTFLALQTELKGGVEASYSRYTLVPMSMVMMTFYKCRTECLYIS